MNRPSGCTTYIPIAIPSKYICLTKVSKTVSSWHFKCLKCLSLIYLKFAFSPVDNSWQDCQWSRCPAQVILCPSVYGTVYGLYFPAKVFWLLIGLGSILLLPFFCLVPIYLYIIGIVQDKLPHDRELLQEPSSSSYLQETTKNQRTWTKEL